MWNETSVTASRTYTHIMRSIIVLDFEGNVLEGSLPRKKQAMLVAWTMMHEDELRANYDLMLDGQLPFRIEPLR